MRFIKFQVNVVFAVTQDVLKLYSQLSQLMSEISSVGVLKMDSSNILQLVNDGFTGFVHKAHFSDNSPPYVNIRYETKCGDLYREFVELSKCDNIQIGQEYEFKIHITLLDYPELSNITQTSIKIEEASISSEFLQIDLDIEDECPCLKDSEGDVKSSQCNFHGEIKCGMCLCESGW